MLLGLHSPSGSVLQYSTQPPDPRYPAVLFHAQPSLVRSGSECWCTPRAQAVLLLLCSQRGVRVLWRLRRPVVALHVLQQYPPMDLQASYFFTIAQSLIEPFVALVKNAADASTHDVVLLEHVLQQYPRIVELQPPTIFT